MKKATTTKTKMRYYAVRELDGVSCRKLYRGWAPIRDLIDKGHMVRFISADSEDEAQAARDRRILEIKNAKKAEAMRQKRLLTKRCA